MFDKRLLGDVLSYQYVPYLLRNICLFAPRCTCILARIRWHMIADCILDHVPNSISMLPVLDNPPVTCVMTWDTWKHLYTTRHNRAWRVCETHVGKAWIMIKPHCILRGVINYTCTGDMVTHLLLDKMAAILQTLFSYAFSWMKSFIFWLKCHWSLFPRFQLNNPTLV